MVEIATRSGTSFWIAIGMVRIEDGVGPNADPLWAFMALPIFAIWLLFTGFYVAGIVYRHRVRRAC